MVTEIPHEQFRSATYKWDFLREALAELSPNDGGLKLNCPNKKQANLAQSAIKNYYRRGKNRLPKGQTAHSATVVQPNGSVNVYAFFEAS